MSVDHVVYAADLECTEDCPACHFEGNRECPDLTYGCDLCAPCGSEEER